MEAAETTNQKTASDTIVFIDDDQLYSRAMLAHLESCFKDAEGGAPTLRHFTDAREAIEFTKSNPDEISVIITDYQMPDMDGLRFIREIEGANRQYQIILLSGQIDLRLTESALHLNIFDFLEKSTETAGILETVRRARSYWTSRWQKIQHIEDKLKEKRLERERDPAAAGSDPEYESYNGIVGRGPAFQWLKETIVRVAQSNATCLIQGPSGSGKELVARAIHNESLRPDGPYVVVNCGAIPSELIESELFGHVKGSFTGALADRVGLVEAARGGTLFLDEVTEMPLHLQVKLLRFLQEGTIQRVGETETRSVDVRIVAATNREPLQAVRDQLFREDLYYRLNVVPIQMTALRDRPEDIPALARHFLSVFTEVEKKPIHAIDDQVFDYFSRYYWPGNIRELRNLIHRMVLFAEGTRLQYADLPRELIHYVHGVANPQEPAAAAAPVGTNTSNTKTGTAAAPATGGQSLRDLERESIEQALIASGYDKEAAARKLGISRASIYRKIRSYNIETRHKFNPVAGG